MRSPHLQLRGLTPAPDGGGGVAGSHQLHHEGRASPLGPVEGRAGICPSSMFLAVECRQTVRRLKKRGLRLLPVANQLGGWVDGPFIRYRLLD